MKQRHYLIALAGVVGIGVIASAFWSDPAAVDTARAIRGPMQATIEEEGITRYRNRYVVSAPVTGQVRRIEVREGDAVTEGEPLLYIEPAPLSPRDRADAEARAAGAAAKVGEVQAQRLRINAEYDEALREFQRARRLLESGGISATALAAAELRMQTALRALEAAGFAERAAQADLAVARSALTAADRNRLAVHTPVTGRVLRLFEDSDRVVLAGTPLLEIGDPSRMEVVVDVLSEDAVKIAPGAPVIIDDWGGETALRGVVRVVEPYARTRISTLGVEEQRVEVVSDVSDPPMALGSGYRVVGKIVIWSGDRALQIPNGALFRIGEGWGLFTVNDGRARRQPVTVGHRAAQSVEIASGIDEGDEVILHPPNDLEDGMAVQPSTSTP